MEAIQKKIGAICNNKDIIKVLEAFGFTLLWSMVFMNSARVQMVTYQTQKDGYAYTACAWLLFLLLLLRKVQITYPPIVVISIGYICGYMRYISGQEWGVEYAKVIRAQHIIILISVILIIDMVRTGKHIGWFQVNKIYVAVTTIAIGASFIMFPSCNYLLLLAPIVMLSISSIYQDIWKRQVVFISASIYLSYCWLMTKSLMSSENIFYTNGRYLGNFQFPIAGGVVSATALLSLVYLYSMARVKGIRPLISIPVGLMLAIYPILGVCLFMNRTSIMAMVIATLACYFIRREKKNKSVKRISFSIAVITLACLLMAMIVIKSMSLSSAEIANIRIVPLRSAVSYIQAVTTFSLDTESLDGVFREGSFLNTLNRFSSSRLGLWYLGIKNVTLWGGSDVGVYFPNGSFMPHTHNTFINWLLKYGAIVGGLLSIWTVIMLIFALREQKRDTSHINFFTLWVVFCFVSMITERVGVNNTPLFFALILQYGILKKNDRDAALENGNNEDT